MARDSEAEKYMLFGPFDETTLAPVEMANIVQAGGGMTLSPEGRKQTDAQVSFYLENAVLSMKD